MVEKKIYMINVQQKKRTHCTVLPKQTKRKKKNTIMEEKEDA